MPNPIPLRGTSLHDGVAARLRSMVFERQLASKGRVELVAQLKALRQLRQGEARAARAEGRRHAR